MKKFIKNKLYLFAVFILLFLCGCGKSNNSLPPLESAKIGTMIGSTGEAVVQQEYPKAENLRYNNYVDEAAALAANKIDYALMDYATAWNYINNNKNFYMLPQKLTDDKTSIALNKSNTELNKKINEVLNRYLSDGTMDKIISHWFREDGSAYDIADVSQVKDGPVLHVAVTTLSEPRCFVKDGKITGMNVELLNRIAYELGMRAEYQDMTFSAMLDSLQSGKSDVIAAMYDTPERENQVDFTAGYMSNPVVLLARKDRATNVISSVSDLNKTDYTIGVPEGSPPEQAAKQYMPNAKISYFTNIVDGIAALKSGKVTAVCYDSASVNRLLSNNTDIEKLPQQLGDIEIAAVMRKNDLELCKEVNEFIKKLKNDDTLEQMDNRWIENTGGKMPDIPEPKNPTKKLKVITNGLTEPMNFYEEGKLTGYDIEFIKRFAAYANIDCEIITMDYSGMLPALQSGKGDIIISDFYKTAERSDEVCYSDTYAVLHNSVVVQKSMLAGTAKTSSGTITSNEQLNGKRIGFITGMAHIDGFRTKYKAQEYEFNDFSSMLSALKAGKIDALLTNDSKAEQITKENPEVTALPYYYQNFSSVGINKNNTELADKLNPIIKRMMEDGTIERNEKKWSGSDEDAKVLTPVDINGKNGTLVAGVLADDYPSSYYKNNELVGIEVELSRLFASELGMNLKLVTMDFSGIISSIQSGKIDMAFYLSYTKERAESIQFLTPMSSDYYVAIVKKAAGTGTSPENTFLTSHIAELKDSFNKTFIVEDRYKLILQGLWTTIVISMLSVLLGSILGALVCAMRRSRMAILSGIATVYIRLIQGVPIVLILMILYYILFAKVDIDPVLIAIVGFSINFAAYASEIFRTAIGATDKGQLEAAYALGFSKRAGFFKVTFPQALRHILPIYKGEFISMVKMTSVVGYIAIQDLTKMSDIIRSRTFDAFFPLFMTAIIYFAVTWLFIFVLGKIERRIDPKRRKRIIKGIAQPAASETEVRI